MQNLRLKALSDCFEWINAETGGGNDEQSAKSACKPGSVRGRNPATAIPLGPWLPTASSNLPGGGAGHAIAPLFGLAPDGVCRPRTLPPGGCALTDDAPRRAARTSIDARHHFTLAAGTWKRFPSRGVCAGPLPARHDSALRGGVFLLHFPSPRDARPLAGILPCGARTFLCANHTQRLPGRLRPRIIAGCGRRGFKPEYRHLHPNVEHHRHAARQRAPRPKAMVRKNPHAACGLHEMATHEPHHPGG